MVMSVMMPEVARSVLPKTYSAKLCVHAKHNILDINCIFLLMILDLFKGYKPGYIMPLCDFHNKALRLRLHALHNRA